MLSLFNEYKHDSEMYRKSIVLMAKTCETMERFDDMCTCARELVKAAVKDRKELTAEERQVVATAYKVA